MLRLAKFLAGVLLALAIELIAGQLHPSGAQAVEPLLVLIVLYAVEGNLVIGMLVGLVAGLVEDRAFSPLIGLHGFSGVLVGYLAARVARQVEIQHTAMIALVGFVAVPLRAVIEALLMRLLLATPPVPEPGWILTQALTTAALAALVVEGGRWAERRWHGYRRRRRRVSMG